ncbi:shieldin complex subunit 2 [Leptonychotes weddellii]|uniref:Shieldin complex subunit 2 n=1 Tax=Leptonychotes weddellii TaxID=9713 RepID=A0A7F8RDT2_LEPWE|nr:shieldin complex subunit 2 [Leptonychotes weddellii]
MSGGSQVHIFLGAPVGPLNMTVSTEPTSLMSTENPWKKIQLLYHQHSLHLRDENCTHETLEDYPVLEANGPLDFPSAQFLTNPMGEPIHVKEDSIDCISETQTVKSQESPPLGVRERTSSDVQICGFKGKVQHLTEEEKFQNLLSENKKIADGQHKDQSNTCGQNFQKNFFQLDHKCAATLDLVCSMEKINVGLGAIEMKCGPTEHHEVQNQGLEFFSSDTEDKPRSEAVRKVADLKISTDTEFLTIMTSSQVAFLSQRKSKGQNFINKGPVSEPKASHREIRILEDNLTQPNDDFAGGCESGQNQAHSLELFSPVCPEAKSSDTHMKSDKSLEENRGPQALFNFEDKPPPSDVCIESYSSGMLCSQLNTFHKSSVKRSWTSEDKLGHSKALSKVLQPSKKIKLVSDAGDPTATMDQRNVSKFKGIKKTSLIQNCDSKSQKYNCLVMVLSPCHVKEISIKSGPNSGSKVPLGTIVVTDQSGIKKKVSLWRAAAFWALVVFPGDIILLTGKVNHGVVCFFNLNMLLKVTCYLLFCRPAVMTIADGIYKVCIHVGSKLIEKILLNISPDWLNRVIAPPSEITYAMVAADLIHSLVAGGGAPCAVKAQSLFVLDENSCPLQQEFSLLDFYPDSGKPVPSALL